MGLLTAIASEFRRVTLTPGAACRRLYSAILSGVIEIQGNRLAIETHRNDACQRLRVFEPLQMVAHEHVVRRQRS